MKTNKWSKTELQVYILLLCANTDSKETENEINLIKSMVKAETFDPIYIEFHKDTEDMRFQKIDDNIHLHEYTNVELAEFRKEMNSIFFSDGRYSMFEENLNRIMDNILY